MPGIQRTLLAVDVGTVALVCAHVSLHVGDVVKFGNVAVFLHIGALVLRHRRNEIIDDFIWNEGMP